MESRFNYKKYIFFGVWAFRETCLALGGSVTTYHYFLLLSQTYVLGNVRSELFFVYGCRFVHIFMLFLFFYSRHLYFYLFYIISKGIFHIGGLVSKMHISVYVLFTEWKCFCFFFFCFLHLLWTIWDYEYSMHTLNILSLNVNGLNSAVKRTCVLEYLHRKSISCALIQETHLKTIWRGTFPE